MLILKENVSSAIFVNPLKASKLIELWIHFQCHILLKKENSFCTAVFKTLFNFLIRTIFLLIAWKLSLIFRDCHRKTNFFLVENIFHKSYKPFGLSALRIFSAIQSSKRFWINIGRNQSPNGFIAYLYNYDHSYQNPNKTSWERKTLLLSSFHFYLSVSLITSNSNDSHSSY